MARKRRRVICHHVKGSKGQRMEVVRMEGRGRWKSWA